MISLFSINKKGTAILRSEALKLAPEFAYLDEKEVLSIILAYDYHSIYRQFPEDERKRRAKAHVFGIKNEDLFEQEKIVSAIEQYKKLQYDIRVNQIMTLKRTLERENNKLDYLGSNSSKELKEILSNCKELRKAIAEIEDELNREDEMDAEAEKEGKLKLSFLERLQTNIDKYNEVIKKRS